MEKILEATSIDTVMSLFGSFDANVKLIEREMGVRITNKDTDIKIIGDNFFFLNLLNKNAVSQTATKIISAL